jgi:hypothetical protein
MSTRKADDPTSSLDWRLQHTDRLIAWEVLQSYMGRGHPQLTEKELSDRVAMPAVCWHVMIRKIKRRLSNAKN